jgi:Domain of unknown function (DUF5047)
VLPVSGRFLQEIVQSHTVYSYVDAISPRGDVVRLAAINTGGQSTVSIDRTADVRRRCTIDCIDPTGTITPKTASAILSPYGTELRPYRGVKYTDGTIEVVPLGRFRLSKVTIKDTGNGTPDIELEGFDFSRTIQRAKFTSIYTVAANYSIVQAIKDIVLRTFPGVTFDALDTGMTTPQALVFDVGNDPWAAASDMATSIGCEVFFDVYGNVVIAPPPDINHLPKPDFSYVEGQGCTMTELDSLYTDDPGFNGVVVTGESIGTDAPPVRAISWDNEPSSPTYHLGPYGEVPQFISDQNITTVDQAQTVADATLLGLLGFSAQLTITAATNPALDAGDTIQVTRAVNGINALYAIDTVTVPLTTADTATINLRQKRHL